MSFKDLFSTQAEGYAKFRPTYPDELYTILMENVSEKGLAVDVGCGTGQATVVLADHFDKVIGIDPTQKQLDNASQHDTNPIEYICATSENISSVLQPNSVDLLTCAQAAHWFDWEPFLDECEKVVKIGGTVAVWGYGTNRLVNSMACDLIVDELYWEKLGSKYWDNARKHIDSRFRDRQLPVEWDVEKLDTTLYIEKEMKVDDYCGYVGTWSSINTWQRENEAKDEPEEDILDVLRKDLSSVMVKEGIENIQVRFPVFLQIAKVIGKRVK